MPEDWGPPRGAIYSPRLLAVNSGFSVGLTPLRALRYTRAPEEIRDGRRLLRCGNRGVQRAGRGGELESPRPAQRLEHGNGFGALPPDGGAGREFGSAGRCPQGQRAGLLLRGRPEARRQRAHRRAFSGGEGDGLLSPLPRLAPAHADDRRPAATDHRGDPRLLFGGGLGDRDARRPAAGGGWYPIRLPGSEDRGGDRLWPRPAPG